MCRIDSLYMVVAASIACCILGATDGMRHYDLPSHNNRHHTQSVRQTTLPRIGREPLDEATAMNGGDSGVADMDEVDKRALRLMRIGRRSWEDDDVQQPQQQQRWQAAGLGSSEEKRAMRLMRLGRRSPLEDFGDETAAYKRAMRLMRLGKKTVGGLYRPSFRYGK